MTFLIRRFMKDIPSTLSIYTASIAIDHWGANGTGSEWSFFLLNQQNVSRTPSLDKIALRVLMEHSLAPHGFYLFFTPKNLVESKFQSKDITYDAVMLESFHVNVENVMYSHMTDLVDHTVSNSSNVVYYTHTQLAKLMTDVINAGQLSTYINHAWLKRRSIRNYNELIRNIKNWLFPESELFQADKYFRKSSDEEHNR